MGFTKPVDSYMCVLYTSQFQERKGKVLCLVLPVFPGEVLRLDFVFFKGLQKRGGRKRKTNIFNNCEEQTPLCQKGEQKSNRSLYNGVLIQLISSFKVLNDMLQLVYKTSQDRTKFLSKPNQTLLSWSWI